MRDVVSCICFFVGISRHLIIMCISIWILFSHTHTFGRISLFCRKVNADKPAES